MLLKWIRLENIRSYTSARLEFSEGLTLLSGDIGTGKSTVLLSIEFALFGLIKGETSGATLLRAGDGKGSVELNFEIDNKDIIIKRYLKRGKSGISQDSSFIITNGIKKETSPVELKAIILNLLGYPQESISQKSMLFRYTVYTPQEDMKRIIFAEKEERLQILRRLFGIDKYKRIRENSEILVRKLREDIKISEGFTSDLQEKKKILHDEKTKAELLLHEIKDYEANEKILTQNKEKISLKVVQLREANKTFVLLMNDMKTLDSELAKTVSEKEANTESLKKLNNEINQINAIHAQQMQSVKLQSISQADIDRKDEFEIRISKMQKQFLEKKELSAKYNERQSNLEKNILLLNVRLKQSIEKIKNLKDLTKNADELEKEIVKKKEIKDRLSKFSKELLEISSAKSGIKAKIDGSRKISDSLCNLDECPTCLQPVDGNHKKHVMSREEKLVGELENQTKKISEQELSLKKFISENETTMKQIEEKEAKLSTIKSNIAIMNAEKAASESLEIEIAKAKEELGKIKELAKSINATDMKKEEEDIEFARKRLKIIDDTVQRSKIIEEKSRHMKTIDDRNIILKDSVMLINKKKIELKEKLKSYIDIEKNLKTEEGSLEWSSELLKKCQIEAATKKSTLKSLTDDMKLRQTEIDNKEKAQAKTTKNKQMMNWMSGSFTEIVSIIEKNVLGTVYGEFSGLFQKWFSEVMEDDILTARLDSEFTPVIQQNGFDTEVDNLSGGEKTALALSYRLALNKVINDVTTEINTKDLIILDEPTDGFSEEQLDRVRDVLKLLGMKQVIIVSHESKIESYVDNIIRIKKIGHESQVEM